MGVIGEGSVRGVGSARSRCAAAQMPAQVAKCSGAPPAAEIGSAARAGMLTWRDASWTGRPGPLARWGRWPEPWAAAARAGAIWQARSARVDPNHQHDRPPCSPRL
jgi:hypothetical protein